MVNNLDFEKTQESFTMQEKLQLLSKIEQLKTEISETDLKKTGRNSFQKYNYFTLEDFLPCVRKLCCKYKIATQFNVIEDKAYLNVFDLETGYWRRWSHQLPKVKDTQINKMGQEVPMLATEQEKNKGALETYARRYLYLAFLELTETDPIDADGREPKDKSKKSSKKGGGKKKYPTPKETEELLRNQLGDDFSLEKAKEVLNEMVASDETTEAIMKLTLQRMESED